MEGAKSCFPGKKGDLFTDLSHHGHGLDDLSFLLRVTFVRVNDFAPLFWLARLNTKYLRNAGPWLNKRASIEL